jgi:tetratricopeptide (TPR) repeat protein
MKNKRILSIGKCSFSPSLEQTPNARSSKNSFSFSIKKVGDIRSKVQLKLIHCQTTLIINLFWLALLFFASPQNLLAQRRKEASPPQFLNDFTLQPKQLRLEGDSIRFMLQGTALLPSGILSKGAHVMLQLRTKQDMLALGEVDAESNGSLSVFSKNIALAYQPWMDEGSLVLQLIFGNRDQIPAEERVLATGVRAPQRWVQLGNSLPGESIQELGLYAGPQLPASGRAITASFTFYFAPGSSDWTASLGNEQERKRLGEFLKKNPDVQELQLTGLQSPEQAEGRNSQLGFSRGQSVGKQLTQSFPALKQAAINYGSRWNDWFDFRTLLADYPGLPEGNKDAFYQIILSEGSYLEKGIALRELPDFVRVSAALYPMLRSVKVELTARPYLGLNEEQAKRLQEALGPNGAKRLSETEWALAAGASLDLEEKGYLYSKMAEGYPSSLPYINLAVVRLRQAQLLPDMGSKEVLWEEAERLLDQAHQGKPNPLVLYNQAQLLINREEYWKAYTLLSDASVLAKGQVSLAAEIDFLRGALDVQRGDYKLALLRFATPISRAKDFFNKGLAHYQLGDYASATAAFEESAIESREFGYGYYGLAWVAMELGQVDTGLDYLQKALQNNPSLRKKAILDPVFEAFWLEAMPKLN